MNPRSASLVTENSPSETRRTYTRKHGTKARCSHGGGGSILLVNQGADRWAPFHTGFRTEIHLATFRR